MSSLAGGDARHLALSGLERLHAEIDGRIPMAPLTRLTGCRPTDEGVGTDAVAPDSFVSAALACRKQTI